MIGPNHAKFNVYENGVIEWDEIQYKCALGKNGLVEAESKREGDLKSPIGSWPIRRVFYRPDREQAPKSSLETIALTPNMGWCDDPKSTAEYNRLVQLPYAFGHEKLWREDRVYDIIVELGYNDDPPQLGRGSAIFIHIKRNDYEGTEGCVALDRTDLLALLETAQTGDFVKIIGSTKNGF